MNFGNKIKSLREEKGLTQKELADMLGTSLKTISNYEVKGTRPRTMKNFEKLADIFDVNVNYLLTDEEYFIMQARDTYGYKGAKDAQDLVESMKGLFAGGELPEEDKDVVFKAISEAYWESKLKNKKYSKKTDGNE